jgi:sugar phosphate isomerase/epimerase
MPTQAIDLSRRDFLARAGTGLAGAALFLSGTERAYAYPLDGLMGLQGWDLRMFFARDVSGTLKTLAGYGYKALDIMAPGPNAEGPTAEQYRQALDAAGMVAHSGHFSATMFEDANWAPTMQTVRTLGVKEMVFSGGAPSGRRGGAPVTVDSWKAYADRLNAAARRTQTDGLQLGWHNHGEFRPIEGGGGLNPYDVLLQNTDPALVKFQFDVGNCMNAGGDPFKYLSQNPTRFFSMHVREVRDGATGLAVGEGTMDWKRIFELAKAANIHNYDVETGAPEETVMEKSRLSAEYLKNFPAV